MGEYRWELVSGPTRSLIDEFFDAEHLVRLSFDFARYEAVANAASIMRSARWRRNAMLLTRDARAACDALSCLQ